MSTQFHGKPFRIHITMQDNGLLKADCNTHVVTDVSPSELEYIYMPYAGINAQVELICNIPEIKEQVKQALITNTNLQHLLSHDHPIFNNIFSNLINSYKGESFSPNSLKDILSKDIPVIIVGAGTSLNKDRLEWLRDQKDKATAIIIGCGSANRILDNNNIHPHFALAFDPLQSEYEAIGSISQDYLDNVPLICTSGLNKTVFNLDWCKKYMFPSGSFPVLGKILQKKIDHIEEGCSGCVTMAVNLVKYLGSNNIVMVGVDLSYDNDRRIYADCDGSTIDESPKVLHNQFITKQIWINEAQYIVNRCKELDIYLMTAAPSLLNEFDVDYQEPFVLDGKRRHICKVLEDLASNEVYLAECGCLWSLFAELEGILEELYDMNGYNIKHDTTVYKGILRSWDLIQSFREVRGCGYNTHLIDALIKNIRTRIRESLCM